MTTDTPVSDEAAADAFMAHWVAVGAATHWEWRCTCGEREVVQRLNDETSEQMDELQRLAAAKHLSAVAIAAALPALTAEVERQALESIDAAHLSGDPIALAEAKMRWWWAESEKHRRDRDAARAEVESARAVLAAIENELANLLDDIENAGDWRLGVEFAVRNLRTVLAGGPKK